MAIIPKTGSSDAALVAYSSKIASTENFFTGADNLQDLDFDPLITGYSFIIWTRVPVWVSQVFPGFKDLTQKNFQSFQGLDDLTLDTAQHQYGFAGNNYEVATNMQKNNTEFTIRHAEYSGSPIKNMYQYWVTGIRDPRTGVATYPRIHKIDYAAKNHTGELLYVVTRPDADNVMNDDINNIEFAALYTNVFPTKLPISHFNYESGSHENATIEMSFKGTINLSSSVDSFAKEKLKEQYSVIYEGGFNPNGVAAPKSMNVENKLNPDATHYAEETTTYNIKTLAATATEDASAKATDGEGGGTAE